VWVKVTKMTQTTTGARVTGMRRSDVVSHCTRPLVLSTAIIPYPTVDSTNMLLLLISIFFFTFFARNNDRILPTCARYRPSWATRAPL
jgi:hypothetical protein